ncbi:MAG TPA: cytochrome c [Parafilimonas sp.]|jgi:mono/diheme cytochrome c family protein|nr:cytochrome c [Parafilimonas sp.]
MLKKFVFVVTAFLACIIIFDGCVYDKADQQYPSTGNCDTTGITYNVEIKAILDANCKDCHNGTASISGINLYDYSTMSGLALDGHFTYGTLLSAVMHQGGAPFMPNGRPMLQDCDIKKIAAWVHSGAPEQ